MGARPGGARGHGAAHPRAVAATSRHATHDATRRAPRALTLTLTLAVTLTPSLTLTPNPKPRTPSAIACAMPKRGTLRAHSGLKCPSRQILPPRYLVRVKVRVRVRLRLSGSGLGARVRGSGSGQVHLLRLAVELGQRELGRHVGVGDGQVELKVVLVLEAIVEVPHLARPPGARLVTLNGEPLVACTGAAQGVAWGCPEGGGGGGGGGACEASRLPPC